MKKAVCISCTHHYYERILPIETALQEAGYACTYITSDFHHIAKKRHTVALPHCVQIPTRAYTRNISVQRIYSHIRFAKDAIAKVRELQPDLLYVEVPPNSLCREAARYKKAFPNVTLIFDVFDMWPESFPNSRAKRLLKLPFGIWARFRNCGLPKADFVFTECALFRDKLKPFLQQDKSAVLYLCRTQATTQAATPAPAQEKLHLCYLGSINNIIDIPTISALIGETNKLRPVVLHIIGDGESRDSFIASVEATGAQVQFHGKIYDNAQKQAIFDMCSFGLNIMKDSVCIGLTMKSVDYFAAGLPIINTISGDTWAFVEEKEIGVNVNREDLAQTARDILACMDKQDTLRANTLGIFHALFSFEKFSSVLQDKLKSLG